MLGEKLVDVHEEREVRRVRAAVVGHTAQGVRDGDVYCGGLKRHAV